MLHSDVDTLERTGIIRDMRLDVFDACGNQSLRRSRYSKLRCSDWMRIRKDFAFGNAG